jgi:hypothetical protein
VGGKMVVMTVVDRFSKYTHFIMLRHSYTALTMAQAFFDQVVRLHGIPNSIVSDRDPIFTSNFWHELFRMSGSTLWLSPAFHPQTDGSIKGGVHGVYLCCLAGDWPKSWLKWLPWAEYCFNT